MFLVQTTDGYDWYDEMTFDTEAEAAKYAEGVRKDIESEQTAAWGVRVVRVG